MKAQDKPLAEMTAVELREVAKREGLSITHLAQRRKADLLVLVERALAERR